jgi:hypothetical protein
MAKSPRKQLRILKRCQQVAELYLQCWTQAEIAAHLGVHQSTVSNDLTVLEHEWRESAIRDFDLARAEELKKLERIEREAWAAWEQSKKPAQSAVMNGEGGAQTARKTIKNRHGDPRMMEIVIKCSAERSALLGLAPQLSQAESHPHENISLGVRRDRVIAIAAQLCERERTGGAGADVATDVTSDVRSLDQSRQVEAGAPPGLPGSDDHASA